MVEEYRHMVMVSVFVNTHGSYVCTRIIPDYEVGEYGRTYYGECLCQYPG